MSEAVVFHGVDSLNFKDIRNNVVRIPEVTVMIKEAQALLDKEEDTPCLMELFLSDSDEIQTSVRVKALMINLVQLGLFSRYKKKFGKPKYVLGNINGKTAVTALAENQSVEDLVAECLQTEVKEQPLQLVDFDAPILAGVKLRENAVFVLEKDNYKKVCHDSQSSLSDFVKKLYNDEKIARYINIGPGSELLSDLRNEMHLNDVEFSESIDLDPMLSWFWPTIKSAC